MSFSESLDKLKAFVGANIFEKIFDKNAKIYSPQVNETNSGWMKSSKFIGINPRLAGSLWNVVKYALTFPENAIHLFPLWECGCEGSLYSPISWKLNSEFIEPELFSLGYATIESQLKLVVKTLHAMNKSVGFDVVMHTDKYSEINFIYPEYFEWVKLNENKTSQLFYPDVVPNEIHKEVQALICQFINEHGDSLGDKMGNLTTENFFATKTSEAERQKIIFGNKVAFRQKRRMELMNYIRNSGYELIPVTEYSPSRPILFDKIVSNEFTNWAEFKLENKFNEASIFNSLTPYKWYNIDNEGYPIKNSHIESVWQYFITKISNFQKEYDFDFIRADMGHNQITHAHNDSDKNLDEKEIWAEIKKRIQKEVPYFGIFAEGFFTRNGYIDIFKDLENKKFDVILGALQYRYLNEQFIEELKGYLELDKSYKPCVTILTADADSPGYAELYQSPLANEVRFFTSQFSNLPSYMGMGVELRSLNLKDNYEYSGSFIKKCPQNYVWGENIDFYNKMNDMRDIYLKIKDKIIDKKLIWLKTNDTKSAGWFFLDTKTNQPTYLFLINLNFNSGLNLIQTSDIPSNFSLEPIYSNIKPFTQIKNTKSSTITEFSELETGEVRIYEFNKRIQTKCTKNKDEILFVTSECLPFAKIGGIGDINRDFIKAFTKKYSQKRIKVMLPFYSKKDTPFSNIDNLNPKLLNIRTKFKYGVFEGTAEIYRCQADEIEAFLIRVSELENKNIPEKIMYPVYNCAIYSILPKIKKYFNPRIIQTTDWNFSLLNYLIKTNASKNKFFTDIKTVQIIHNAGDNYHGQTYTFLIALYTLSEKELKKLIKNETFQKYIKMLSKSNPEFFSNKQRKIREVLKVIATNYEYLLNKNYTLFDKIDVLISILFEDKKCWDYFKEYNSISAVYNPLALCINKTDYWITDSRSYYKEITQNFGYSESDALKVAFGENKYKGCGIICGLDSRRYLPSNENEIKFPFCENNFIEGKKLNKKFLQEFYSRGHKFKFDRFLSNQNYNFRKIGYLDISPDVPLFFCSSRLDIYQKGTDIFIKAIEQLIENGQNIQLIFVQLGISSCSNNIVLNFIENVAKNDLYQGKVLVVDNFVPVQQYFAGSDVFVFPSRYEPCGLTHFQAMKYGCIPVVANTGGLKDTIVTLEENPESAVGFKTQNDLKECEKPFEVLANEISKSINLYNNNKIAWIKMMKNCLNYDSGWEKSVDEFYNLYQRMADV